MTEVTVQLMGGLGNQLFQVAAAYAYAKRHNKQLVLNTTVIGGRPTYYDTWLHAFSKHINPRFIARTQYNEPFFHYKSIPTNIQKLYGYFQSSKYFDDCKEDIRKLFDLPISLKESIHTKYAWLLALKDVGVVMHVRRTDYFTKENTSYHGVITENYYHNSITKIRTIKPDGRIIVFSDDLEWCKTKLGSDVIYIDEPADYISLYLMSQFHMYIISNSSFSWWATWLGEPATTVIAPDQWFGPAGPQDWSDIYEPNWFM